MDKKLELLFEDLEANGMDNYAYKYNVKEANQIIRKHFEALILPVVGSFLPAKIQPPFEVFTKHKWWEVDGKQHHLTLTDDGINTKVFVNGELKIDHKR